MKCLKVQNNSGDTAPPEASQSIADQIALMKYGYHKGHVVLLSSSVRFQQAPADTLPSSTCLLGEHKPWANSRRQQEQSLSFGQERQGTVQGSTERQVLQIGPAQDPLSSGLPNKLCPISLSSSHGQRNCRAPPCLRNEFLQAHSWIHQAWPRQRLIPGFQQSSSSQYKYFR